MFIIIHGFAEHSGRYINVVNMLIYENIAIYALDHLEHGRSDGRLNYVNSFNDYIYDLIRFEDFVVERHPNATLLLMGHSMGSLISAHFIAQHSDQQCYSLLILSRTGSVFGSEINRIRIYIAKVLSLTFPKLSIPSNLDAGLVTRDKEVIANYLNDRLVHHKNLSVRLIAEMMNYTNQMEDAVSNINIPTLIQTGSEDVIFDHYSFKELFEAINNETKQLKLYEGFRYKVYKDLGNEVALDDLKSWVDKFVNYN